MDKNKIKSFAIWARRKMIESVTEKAERIGITKDKIEEVEVIQGGFKLGEETFYLSSKHRDALIHQIDEKGFEEVMEEVAYTWFNRFMGLRYMEVNDYLPSGIRILSSSVEGKVEPDVLSKVSDIIEELSLNGEEIYELLDSGTTNDREKAYRIILVKQCNELGKIIPQMFEKISDYTELLLPDNLLEEGSVIRKMVEDIEESDWKEEVEIIGWMYQYYISEKKDEVFAALKKNVKITKENIPAATQLFTPKWIVKYMVENSLGRLWLEGHPNAELQSEWKYYLEEAKQEPEVEEELQKIREEHSKLTPEDIRVLDPCMGSGHILVYAFDVLYEIYKTAGYSEREIPKLILQNNLYGLDIDDRAAQLASFALIMKARHYNRRLFREIEKEDLELNICSIQESNEINEEAIDYFANGNKELKNDVMYLVDVFTDAKEYGSILEVKAVDFKGIKQRLKEVEYEDNLIFGDYRKIIIDNLPCVVKQGELMSRLYEVCVTNPPYMGNKGINGTLKNYIDSNYPNTKGDLFSAFIERGIKYTKKNGDLGFMTPFVWLFISSYEQLRELVSKDNSISTLIHLEYSAFEDATVPLCTFTLKKSQYCNIGTYVRLADFTGGMEVQNEKFIEANKKIKCEYKYESNAKNFSIIPGIPIAYWLSEKMLNSFRHGRQFSEYGETKKGVLTGNDARFVRMWHEVDFGKIGFKIINYDQMIDSKKKWFPITGGGNYRKWYGNFESIVNLENDAYEIKYNNKNNFRLRDNKYYFKQCLTWTEISSKAFSVRFVPMGILFGNGGPTCFVNKQIEYFLALLNSKFSAEILKVLAPTINFGPEQIKKIPCEIENCNNITQLSKRNVGISKNEWDSFETSWDFEIHPLLKMVNIGQRQYKLSSVFNMWETKCEENFAQLKSNEEELNKIFIDIYGLQDELTPEVEDKDITIRKADRTRDIKSLISYAIGCMFGRYSIDTEGLIYAGGEFSDKWEFDSEQCKVKSYIDIPENDLGTIRAYKSDENGNLIDEEHQLKEEAKKEEVWIDASFVPDKDNIIPITEDEYFEDDIVSRFIEFIRTIYGEENLEENLDYIADSIGRKTSESARQAIRRYFIKDFYKDHLKIYQKRPIYWMFDSGKNDGFKCLIYMHRYNDQTVAKVRTDYLHTLQRKYEAEINRQQLIVDSSESTTKDKTVAKKKIDRINKQIEECKEYDEVVAYLANEKISIDLDDGVKVNYSKFQDVKVINSKNKEVKMNLLAKI
ncbi:BREX-1 system adenine-specific DNA-methyltransferase PglX [Clostridium butyricum]|uniref:BREX-1 system adenine-specific DNA-methyltransferase PglX n=1 Tax=Clostridium butyricum TaxID=1492 RepID=UPI0018A8F83F|nr:BREX-1 system adenine-specific DNA-methyltransferase PglX [Clostridium butyricum]MDB2157861.1 BREX-1 system adenine-specific DNA-methyltransferase PglX [Clostridium butyricum]